MPTAASLSPSLFWVIIISNTIYCFFDLSHASTMFTMGLTVEMETLQNSLCLFDCLLLEAVSSKGLPLSNIFLSPIRFADPWNHLHLAETFVGPFVEDSFHRGTARYCVAPVVYDENPGTCNTGVFDEEAVVSYSMHISSLLGSCGGCCFHHLQVQVLTLAVRWQCLQSHHTFSGDLWCQNLITGSYTETGWNSKSLQVWFSPPPVHCRLR